MEVSIKQITVTITEEEANSIRNVLLTGLDNKHVFDPTPEIEGASNLLRLLTGNFHSSIPDVHKPKRTKSE